MQRTRSKIVSNPDFYVRVGQKASYDPGFTYYNRSNLLAGAKTITDNVSPGYFKMMREGGLLPNNPLSISESYWDLILGSSEVKENHVNGVRYTLDGAYAALELPIGTIDGKRTTLAPPLSAFGINPYDERKINQHLTSALANAKSKSMDVLTFAAEFHKTVDMVNGVAYRAAQRAKTIMNLKKVRSLKSHKERLSAFSDSWLEYRYGWRILAYELDDLQKTVKKLLEGYPFRWRAKSEALDIKEVKNTTYRATGFSTDYASGSGPWFRDVNIKETHRLKLKTGVMWESWMQSLIFVDPLTTAVELVPYSFVVDWFFNLSDVLTALSPFHDGRLLQTYARIDMEREYSITANMVANPPGYLLVRNQPSKVVYTSRQAVRTPKGLDFPLTLGTVDNFDNLKRVDLLALLWGRVRTLRRITSL